MIRKILLVCTLGTVLALCPVLAPAALRAWRAEPVPAFKASASAAPYVPSFGHCSRTISLPPIDFAKRAEQGGCAFAGTGEVVVASEFHPGPYGALPITISRPTDASLETARLVAIVVVGGPSGSIYPDYEENELAKYMVRVAARDGVLTITPGYLGTSTRSLHPRESLAPAIAELGHLLRSLRRIRPDGPICLIGASLGGYMAARLTRDFPDMPMLALNPQARSSADMRRDELRRFGNRLWYHPVRRHEPEGRTLKFVGEEMVLYSEIVQAFFGASFDRTLTDQLNPEARDFTIAYSPIEPRVRAAQLEAAASRIPGLRLIETEPVEHQLGDIDNFWAFRPVIDQFLEQCAGS